ncbi:hypothetical protein [Arthrobacter sp. NPDC057009]|uniref:hypothetical protein n=1 Tax=Arthrobacter sp. NPDC057009 TaxID=3345996 RepID=UPI00363F7782
MGQSTWARRITAAGAALTLAAALGGCASAAVPAAAPSSDQPPADGGSYGTVSALKDAVVGAGLECSAWDEHNSTKLAASSGKCGDDLIMATYASDTSKDEQLNLWKSFGEYVEMKVLVGRNWTVSTDSAADLQKKLGGTVFTTPGKK